MSDTIFAKIARKEIPAQIVFEDEAIVAFRDVHPQAPTHILIIPRRAIATTNDLEEGDAELIGRMVLAAKKIAAAEGIAERGYRLVLNCNPEGGQSVYHLHLHLLGGRVMGWPPG